MTRSRSGAAGVASHDDPHDTSKARARVAMPTLLLTGANRGIGLEAAAQFAQLEPPHKYGIQHTGDEKARMSFDSP